MTEYRSPKGTAQHELGLHAVQQIEKLGLRLVWAEPTCQDCDWWGAPYDSILGQLAECKEPMMIELFCGDYEPATPPHFGCCYFAPRKICTTVETSVEDHPLCATCGKPIESSLANMGPAMDTLRAACGWCICEVQHGS